MKPKMTLKMDPKSMRNPSNGPQHGPQILGPDSEGIANTCECLHVQCSECSDWGEITTCFHCRPRPNPDVPDLADNATDGVDFGWTGENSDESFSDEASSNKDNETSPQSPAATSGPPPGPPPDGDNGEKTSGSGAHEDVAKPDVHGCKRESRVHLHNGNRSNRGKAECKVVTDALPRVAPSGGAEEKREALECRVHLHNGKEDSETCAVNASVYECCQCGKELQSAASEGIDVNRCELECRVHLHNGDGGTQENAVQEREKAEKVAIAQTQVKPPGGGQVEMKSVERSGSAKP